MIKLVQKELHSPSCVNSETGTPISSKFSVTLLIIQNGATLWHLMCKILTWKIIVTEADFWEKFSGMNKSSRTRVFVTPYIWITKSCNPMSSDVLSDLLDCIFRLNLGWKMRLMENCLCITFIQFLTLQQI